MGEQFPTSADMTVHLGMSQANLLYNPLDSTHLHFKGFKKVSKVKKNLLRSARIRTTVRILKRSVSHIEVLLIKKLQSFFTQRRHLENFGGSSG